MQYEVTMTGGEKFLINEEERNAMFQANTQGKSGIWLNKEYINFSTVKSVKEDHDMTAVAKSVFQLKEPIEKYTKTKPSKDNMKRMLGGMKQGIMDFRSRHKINEPVETNLEYRTLKQKIEHMPDKA